MEIYDQKCNKYFITEEDKTDILNSLKQEFGIRWEKINSIDLYDLKYQIIINEILEMLNQKLPHSQIEEYINTRTKGESEIIFSLLNFSRKYRIDSIWASNPPLSNIKCIVEQFTDAFENSATDNLCREIHNKYI